MVTRMLSALCHTHISTSDKVLNPKFPSDTPTNYIYKIQPFSSRSDHVTFWHVTSCYMCDTHNFELKFIEGGDNEYILMLEVALGSYWAVKGKMTSGYKNDKKWQWSQSNHSISQ